MAKLPRTDELTGSEDGYDGARVDEAFAAFADRMRELESIAGELRAELRTLRAERAGIRRAAEPLDEEEWPVEPGLSNAGLGPSPDWVASVPVPIVRPVAIPRIALESAFLLLVALFAGLADLSAAWIALVMAAAWGLVAISEWAAATKRARWRLEDVAAPLPLPGETAAESTGPWNMPVVEATAVELPDVSESHTVVAQPPVDAKLAPSEDVAVESAAKPVRKGIFRRRHRASETAADPWEA